MSERKSILLSHLNECYKLSQKAVSDLALARVWLNIVFTNTGIRSVELAEMKLKEAENLISEATDYIVVAIEHLLGADDGQS